MNIPLDRLYQFIETIAEKIYGDRVIIYRFSPHGSKNIQDLNPTRPQTWLEDNICPHIWCHDQEPLDHSYYQQNLRQFNKGGYYHTLQKITNKNPIKNLNYRTTIFSKGLLLHSEQRSTNVELYLQDEELIPVYYWSHAIIARDWFRYAEHIKQQKKVNRLFLIYNRAWSNTREYRLKFAELLIEPGLTNQCKINVNPIEPELGIHYDLHNFKNPIWRPVTVLENFFPINNAHSHYSADFDIEDYETTDIEVVLETLFDDKRLHLTEKSLRPIACGQPFILASTHGSLEYLRGYGFKTFGDIWNESYDNIEDPQKRLCAIVDLMKQISSWDSDTRERNIAKARSIAEHNRRHFLSQDFFDTIINELKTNLTAAFATLKNLPANKEWIEHANIILNSIEMKELIKNRENPNGFTISNVEKVLELTTTKWSV
jgi:hypothetical protein